MCFFLTRRTGKIDNLMSSSSIEMLLIRILFLICLLILLKGAEGSRKLPSDKQLLDVLISSYPDFLERHEEGISDLERRHANEI